jgi:hypothetical protein
MIMSTTIPDRTDTQEARPATELRSLVKGSQCLCTGWFFLSGTGFVEPSGYRFQRRCSGCGLRIVETKTGDAAPVFQLFNSKGKEIDIWNDV